jgi:hypothetical protein
LPELRDHQGRPRRVRGVPRGPGPPLLHESHARPVAGRARLPALRGAVRRGDAPTGGTPAARPRPDASSATAERQSRAAAPRAGRRAVGTGPSRGVARYSRGGARGPCRGLGSARSLEGEVAETAPRGSRGSAARPRRRRASRTKPRRPGRPWAAACHARCSSCCS